MILHKFPNLARGRALRESRIREGETLFDAGTYEKFFEEEDTVFRLTEFRF